MTTTNQTKLTPRLNARLTAYTAVAGTALAVTATTLPNAKAAVVYSGPLTTAVPQNSFGIYLDLHRGDGGRHLHRV